MSQHRILVAGMSHVASLERGWRDLESSFPDVEAIFMDLRTAPVFADALAEYERCARSADAIILMLRGNEHTVVGLANAGSVDEARNRLDVDVKRGMEAWLDGLLPLTQVRLVLLPPPPPIEDIEPILVRKQALQTSTQRRALGATRTLLETYGLRPPGDRLALWQHQCRILSGIASSRGIELLDLPDDVLSLSGMLSPDCCGDTDLTHGNALYGSIVFKHVIAALTSADKRRCGARQSRHPYENLPEYAYWRQAVGELPADSINPVVAPRFKIAPGERIATAGSCFAQHLSRRLQLHGLNFMDVEPLVRGPYPFSAQYGNVYTSRQLLQLFRRAFGAFVPTEMAWRRPDGRYCDPFRPRITHDGHPDAESVSEASRTHLEAVRQMFLELNLFVFTLGLTECWINRTDGAVYPVSPGVVAGEFDPDRHAFLNLGYAEVKDDMTQFLQSLWRVNPQARILLTISPVPMVATYESRHILVSNTESKSILRAVAGDLRRGDPRVEYFPSYELIAGTHCRGKYFATDDRSVTDEGVDHVMRVFMDSFATTPPSVEPATPGPRSAHAYDVMEAVTDALCEEEVYALGWRPAPR